MPYEYWTRKIDKDGYRKEKQKPPNLNLQYYDSLGDPGERRFRVWVEPEGWEPDWQGPNENSIWFIANKPRLEFVFERSNTIPPEHINMRDGRIRAYYRKDDDEHRLFLNRVLRIVGRMTTNVLRHTDRDTKIVDGPPMRTVLWAGPHARAWCLEDPRRTLGSDWRPVEPERE